MLITYGLLLAVLHGAMASIKEEPWGAVDGVPVKKYTLTNDQGHVIDVINYGATIISIKIPDRCGNVDDVVLGFDSIEGYLSKDNPYFGATIGRVANRIGKGRFRVDGVEYNVSRNDGENSLHGGTKGWSMKMWNSTIHDDKVIMTLLSEDNDEGYPGAVIAVTSFYLSDDGELVIEMNCFASKATPINLTNHSYFNLAGHGANAEALYMHKIILNSDRYVPVDSDGIAMGYTTTVARTIMDLRNYTVLGDVMKKVPGGGFDVTYCLPERDFSQMQFVGKVVHPFSGRYLEIRSNQPGVQFYTGNFLPEVGTKGIVGKNGSVYYKHGALCLETQNYPDAVNYDKYPNSVLRPGILYRHIVTYKFGITDA